MAPRKPKGTKKMDVTLSFLTDKDQSHTLELAKFYLQKSKGDIIREALTEYLKKNFPDEKRKKLKSLLNK